MSNVILGRHHIPIVAIKLIGSVCIQDAGDVYGSYRARLDEASGIVYIVIAGAATPNVSRLLIVDATTPSSPTRKSKTDLYTGVLGYIFIANHGTQANILLPSHELQIWDCADPTTPVKKSTTSLARVEFWITAWTASGTKYVAFNYNIGSPTFNEYLYCYDVSDPTAPSKVGEVLSEYSDFGPYYSSSIFMHAIDVNKYVWFDVSDPTAPSEVTRWDTALTGMYGPLVAANGRLYSIDYNYSYAFRLYDVSSSPNHPLESTTSIYKFPGAATCRDNYLFTGATDSPPPDYLIESWDSTNMASPVAMAQAPDVNTYEISDMKVDGSYIYVVAQKTTDSGKYYLLVFQLIGF